MATLTILDYEQQHMTYLIPSRTETTVTAQCVAGSFEHFHKHKMKKGPEYRIHPTGVSFV